jgi:hypothetical protein
MHLSVPIEFGVKWKGKYIRPSKSATREMIEFGMDLNDVVEMLDTGKDGENRDKNTIEKYIMDGRKKITVVAVLTFAYDIQDEIWLIKHLG